MPSRCGHKLSTRKREERIASLITFMEGADRLAMGAKLKEIWATPQSTITEPRLLLTMGADPSCLYDDEYGKKTLVDRMELGSVCEECAAKWHAFLEHALNIHGEMWEKKPVQLGKRRNGGLITLCCDGGGMRGLVSIVCLLFASRRIFGDESLPNCFDWLIGTSTGSVFSLNLAKGKTASECFYDYWKMKNIIFENGSTMKRLLGDQVAVQTKNMNTVLSQSFPTQTFQTCNLRLTVPALDISYSPAKLHIFRNYSFTLPFGSAIQEEDVYFRDAARASSSAPTYFEPLALGDRCFVDGSFVANYPLNILFKEYDLFAKHGNPIDLAGVVSIGTGEPAIVKRKYKCGTNLRSRAKNIGHVTTLILEQVVGQDLTAVEMASDRCAAAGIPFFRISPLGINVRIDQTDDGKLMDMVWATLLYLMNNLPLIDSLGAFLHSAHNNQPVERRRSNTVL